MIHRWGRPLAAVPALLIFVGCFMSVSRSAVIVVAVSFIVLLLGWPRRWRIRALLIMPFAVVGLRLAVPGLVGTLISLFKNVVNDPSVSGRTNDYGVVLDVAGTAHGSDADSSPSCRATTASSTTST